MTPPIIKRYIVAFGRHKWVGLTGFAVVLSLSGIAALQPEAPITYTAEGILVYVEPPLNFSATAVTIRDQGKALSEAKLLSDEVVEFVSQQLEEQNIDVKPEGLRRSADAKVDNTAVLQVTLAYQDVDGERAKLIAGLLMDAMAEQSRIFNTVQLNRIAENLNALLPQVEQDLKRAEQRLESYIREEGPVLQAAQDGSLVGGITGAQNQQRTLELTIRGLNAQISILQQRLGLNPDQAYASSALSADPIIATLRAQIYQAETQRKILEQRLQPEHPQMVDLAQQERAYESLLQQRVQEVIGGGEMAAPLRSAERIRQSSSLDPARQELANRLVALQAELETQQQLLSAQRQLEQELLQEYQTLPNKQLEQARLTQEAALKRAFFDQIQARLEDVTLAEKEVVGSLVVAQPPQVSASGSAIRNPAMILLLGGFIGLLVGGGLIVLLDSLDSTFHTQTDLQNALRQQEVPLLGLLPYVSEQSGSHEIPIISDIESPYLDFFERFRSNLRRTGGTKIPTMVLLTSTVGGEGKTFSAYNLAIASALAGKRTLLIEADLRSPSFAHLFNVYSDPNFASEPLRYYGSPNDAIRLVPNIENLYILPSPGSQRQAAAVLESTEMRRILEDAKVRFDFVILDTPALSRCNDALLLEPFTDGIILVTRPGYTEEGLLTEVAEQFVESDDMQFLGAVINGADVSIERSDPVEDVAVADDSLELDDVHAAEDALDEISMVMKDR